jgi:uncharacterized protein (DUF2344 family)
MTGKELLWPKGEIKDPVDFTSAAADIEFDRLSALLLSFGQAGTSGSEALNFLMPLTTRDRETIAMRQQIISDLLENPSLLKAFTELSGLITDITLYSDSMERNISGRSVTKIDAAMDGIKKAIVNLEKNISAQAAAIMEEMSADNRYAQLLRAVLFRHKLLKAYSRALKLLKDAFTAPELKLFSGSLKAFKLWAESIYESDGIDRTITRLKDIDGWWKGIAGFSIDVCLNGSKDVVGLEVGEVRSDAFEKNGMLETESKEGISALFTFPQNGSASVFQEYLLSEAGYEVRNELTRLRGEIIKLCFSGKNELLSFEEALKFYTAAAEMCGKLKVSGLAVCRPDFSDLAQIDASGAYMAEFALTGINPPVPNDIYLGGSGCANLITGPNSSGKTSYIIMAGQLVWLFQLGCLLPCRSAALKPVDKIMTLFASGESKTGEDSRMGMEGIKIAECTKKMTPVRLVLLNEPMTSTSAGEAIDICIDLICEFINKKVSSMTVTHFTDIYGLLVRRLEDEGKNHRFKSYVMTTNIESDGSVSYLYKLTEAPPMKSSHARAVVGRLGVTLDAMLERLNGLGLDIKPDDPAWNTLRRELI